MIIWAATSAGNLCKSSIQYKRASWQHFLLLLLLLHLHMKEVGRTYWKTSCFQFFHVQGSRSGVFNCSWAGICLVASTSKRFIRHAIGTPNSCSPSCMLMTLNGFTYDIKNYYTNYNATFRTQKQIQQQQLNATENERVLDFCIGIWHNQVCSSSGFYLHHQTPPVGHAPLRSSHCSSHFPVIVSASGAAKLSMSHAFASCFIATVAAVHVVICIGQIAVAAPCTVGQRLYEKRKL